MMCPACNYRNPGAAEICVECGSGLIWDEVRDAEEQFTRQLTTTVERVAQREARSAARSRVRASRD